MKRKHAEEHFNAEAWLLPYADMITLMLAFFIILYALSIDSKGKFDEFAQSVRLALGLPSLVEPGGKVPPLPGRPTEGKYKPSRSGSTEKSRDAGNRPDFVLSPGQQLSGQQIEMVIAGGQKGAGQESSEAADSGKKEAGTADAGQKQAGATDAGQKRAGATEHPAEKQGGMSAQGNQGAQGQRQGDEQGAQGRAGQESGGFSQAPDSKIGGQAATGDLGARGESVGPERGGPEKSAGSGLAERGDRGAEGLKTGEHSGGMAVSGRTGALGERDGRQRGGVAEDGRRGLAGDTGRHSGGQADVGALSGGRTRRPDNNPGGSPGEAGTADLPQAGQGTGGEENPGDHQGNRGREAGGMAARQGDKIGGRGEDGQRDAGISAQGQAQGGASTQEGKLQGGATSSSGPQAGGAGHDATRRILAMLWALGDTQREHFRRGEIQVQVTSRGLELSFRKDILFELGTATLTPGARKLLGQVAQILAALPDKNDVRVEGHTDAWPVSSFLYPSNWELSTARATAVVRQLTDFEGLSSARFGAAGYGEHRPIDSNRTAEGRRNNRRVDIVILNADDLVEIPKGLLPVPEH